MKTELQKKLLEKYPQFFTHLENKKICIGEKTDIEEVAELLHQKEIVVPMQFGFECGDGWYMLLDELMGEIQNHIENENRNRKNEFNHKFLRKLSYWLRIRTSAKQKRLRVLGEWIYKNAPKGKHPPISIHIDQIKEKFGGLRFYFSGGDEEINGMVSLAESLSYRICEACGTTKNVGQTGGWIYTVCWDCLQKNPRAKDLKWKLNKK